MAVTAKPASYTVGAATLRPNHLWMFDEGSGTTLTDQGSTGGKNLTIVGADWDNAEATHGKILSFVAANSDYAHRTETGAEPVFGITTGFSLLLVLRVADLPATIEYFAGIADSGATNVYYRVGADQQGDPQISVRDGATGYADDNTVAAGLGDDVWHALVFTCGDATQDTTVDGAGSQAKTLAANINDAAIDWLTIGAGGGSALIYGDVKIAAAALWVNTQLTPTQAESLWNVGDVWTAMGVTVTPAPTFDTAPAVASQTATAYTISYNADANATTIYVGAYTKDATAPTASQLKAGTGALATATEAATGSADSIVLTPTESPAFPLYDLHAVLEGPGGFSAVVSLVDEPLDAPIGYQFVTVDVPWGATEESFLDGASPAAVDGDIIVCDTHFDSYALGADAHVLTMAADGVASVSSGEDASRLAFTARFYDVSTGGWSDAAFVTHYINNVAPVYSTPLDSEPFLLQRSVAMPAVNRNSLWADAEGDALTVAFQDALPAGTTDTAGSLEGTPTAAYGDYVVTDRATDITGDYTEVETTITIGDLVPDVVDTAQAAAISTIEAVASMTAVVGSSQSSQTIAAGNVISQDPAAGVLVAPTQEVSLTISLGPVDQSNAGFTFTFWF